MGIAGSPLMRPMLMAAIALPIDAGNTVKT